MILQDNEILKRIENNEIIISPKPKDEQIQPASIDLKLGNEYLQPVFGTEIDIKNNRINLHITSQLEDKLLQHQVLQASSMWVMANILKDYCLLSYSDYQKWKHNYPNINLFELVLGRKVDLETVLRTYQAFLNDQDDTSHDDNQPDAL